MFQPAAICNDRRVLVALSMMLTWLALATRSPAATVTLMQDLAPREGDSLFQIPVLVSGGERIQGITVALSINDGGPPLGGDETAAIVDVIYQGGTIFDGFVISPSVSPSLPSPGAAIGSATITSPGVTTTAGTVTTSEVAMIFVVDLSRFSEGDVIRLNPNAAGLTTLASSAGTPVDFDPIDLAGPEFNVRIQAAAIPEPGSMLFFAALGLAWQRRSKAADESSASMVL